MTSWRAFTEKLWGVVDDVRDKAYASIDPSGRRPSAPALATGR